MQNLKFSEAFAIMKQNKSFMFLFMAFALMFGFYVALGNLISSIFTPFDLTAHDIAMVGLYLLGSGVVGAILIGTWVDRTGLYKMTMIILGIANIVFLGLLNQTLYHIEESKTLFLVSACLMGFTSVSYIPLSLSFAAELTFPLQPALVNGALVLGGQSAAFVMSIIFAFMLDINIYEEDGTLIPEDVLKHSQADRAWWTIFCFCIISSVSFCLSLFVKEDLRRLRFGKE